MSVSIESFSVVTYTLCIRTLYEKVEQESRQGGNKDQARNCIPACTSGELCFLGAKFTERRQ